ncbi:hypothetical protein BDF22DRAFT_684977 [Syncephalis plumigaleata]|nr:hypothetical protein BDF22DRAFT_684977 [Syncephalis plumigaleata]
MRQRTPLLAIIAAYGITMLLVNWSFFKLPHSKPLDAAGQSSEFSGDAAWYHLQQFASKPHPINSRENDVSRAYLEDELRRLQEVAMAANRSVEIDFEDRAVYYNSDVSFDADMAGIPRDAIDAKMGMFYHSRNLLLRFPGVETNKSILFSAHYDSVPTSNGASDNGMAVASLLELIRAIIHNPPTRHGLMFNLNNGEEVGLLGTRAFLQHPWAEYVHSFINIDCGGVGGKAMVFQVSGADVLEGWAATVPHTHGNVIANDLFAAGIIRSGTDYVVYQKKWPGIDMAFYERRGWYHTQKDATESISPIPSMANLIEISPRTEATFDAVESKRPKRLFSVYYDLFGRVMITSDYAKYQWENVILLVLASVLTLRILVKHTRQTPNTTMSGTIKLLVHATLQTLLSMLAAILIGLIWSTVFSLLNQLVIYRHPNWSLIVFVLLSIYAMDFSRYHRWHRPLNGQLRLAGLCMVWSLAVLFATFIAYQYRTGALYYVQFGLIGCISAIIYGEISDCMGWNRASGFGRLLLCAILPSALFMDITDVILNGFAPNIVDGVPAFALYAALSVLAATITLPLIPFLPKRPVNSGLSIKPWTSFQLQIASVITLVLLLLSDYSVNTPVKVMTRQRYTPNNDTNIMSLIGPRDLDRTSVLARGTTWPSITWTIESPKFSHWPPVNVRAVKDSVGLVQVYTPESRYCYLTLPKPYPLAVLRHRTDGYRGLEPFQMSFSDKQPDSIATSSAQFGANQEHSSSDDWLASDIPITHAGIILGRFDEPWAFRVIGAQPNDLIKLKCEFDDIERHSSFIGKIREHCPNGGTGVLEVLHDIRL